MIRPIIILLIGLVLSPLASHAAVLAHDGFESGGAAPTASQYFTSGGYSTDAIAFRDNLPATTFGGQNPNTLGFAGAWSTPDNTASAVYLRALSSSLSYTSPDSISLITNNGSASLFRSGTSGAPAPKTYERDISVTGALPSTLYFSVLVQFTASQPILFRTQTLGASVKPAFGFGVDASGFGFVSLNNATTGATTTSSQTASALTTGTTHLLVMKVEQTSNAVVDNLTLYVDPQLGSEGLNTSAAFLTGDFFVAQNAAFELTKLFVTGTPNNGSVLFDEFRISTSWADIASTIPEPSRATLALLSLAILIARRRRA